MPVERGYLIRSMFGFSPCRMPVTRRVRPECIVGRPAPRAEERSVPLCWPTGDATMGPKRRGDRLGKGGPCRFLEPGAGEMMRGGIPVVKLRFSTVYLSGALPLVWDVLCRFTGGQGLLTHRVTIEAKERARAARL